MCIQTLDREFLVSVNFVEIYKEVVTDLLHENSQTLDIREIGVSTRIGIFTPAVKCCVSIQILLIYILR